MTCDNSGLFPIEHGIPTSVDFIGCDPAHAVASFTSGCIVIYDLETSQSLLQLSAPSDSSEYFISV